MIKRFSTAAMNGGNRARTPSGPVAGGGPFTQGYTLIEVIGVLTILMILAAAAAENVLEKMKRTARDTEGANLATFSSALQQTIPATLTIPVEATWTQVLASQLALPASKVASTPQGNLRRFLVDPACLIGTNTLQAVPYTQASAGCVSAPANARVAIVSSLAQPLPAIVLNATTFSNIWNSPPDTLPVGWPGTWAPYTKDLKIQRLDVGNLFHRLVLNNQDTQPAPYSVRPDAATNYVGTNQPRVEAWYIDSTAIDLRFGTNNPIGAAGNSVQARQPMNQDLSFAFQNGRWGRYLGGGSGTASSGNAFGQMVDAFLQAATNPNAKFYSDQRAVVDMLFTYLFFTAEWANQSFLPDGPQVPEYMITYEMQSMLAKSGSGSGDFSYNLLR